VDIQIYKEEILKVTDSESASNFTQKNFFHGTPKVFQNDDEYYNFRKRIADNFDIGFYEVFVVGSSKFGFSPYKLTYFSYESDIDVVIFNETLFENFFNLISDYQYKIRKQIIRLNRKQYKDYVKFVKYFTMGWMRPDLLPKNTNEFKEIRDNWELFFKSISYSQSEVGNYKVQGGLFKNQRYAEKYYNSSIETIQQKIKE
jgi:hypothetical protein